MKLKKQVVEGSEAYGCKGLQACRLLPQAAGTRQCGIMSEIGRNKAGLEKAIEQIRKNREEFWKDVKSTRGCRRTRS